MAKVNVVDKSIELNLIDIIKYQIITYCHLRKITISPSDLDCLVDLCTEQVLPEFCNKAYKLGYFKSPQSVRNALGRLEIDNLLIKSGPLKKRSIVINPVLNIQSKGNILLNHKIIYRESNKL